MPWDPDGPISPCGPCDPEGPGMPCIPWEPDGPVSPCGPWEPDGPWDPDGPWEPDGPCEPDGPWEPEGPVSPIGPIVPVLITTVLAIIELLLYLSWLYLQLNELRHCLNIFPDRILLSRMWMQMKWLLK